MHIQCCTMSEFLEKGDLNFCTNGCQISRSELTLFYAKPICCVTQCQKDRLMDRFPPLYVMHQSYHSFVSLWVFSSCVLTENRRKVAESKEVVWSVPVGSLTCKSPWHIGRTQGKVGRRREGWGAGHRWRMGRGYGRTSCFPKTHRLLHSCSLFQLWKLLVQYFLTYSSCSINADYFYWVLHNYGRSRFNVGVRNYVFHLHY